MTIWKPDALLRAILVWTAITTVVFWLPLIRGPMDGDTYAWGLAPSIGGRGIGGDYWILPIAAAFALAMLWYGWRGGRMPFHALILLWHVPLGVLATVAAVTNPDDFRLRGDTLGIDVPLAWIAPLLFGGFALLALYWVVRDLRSGRERLAPAWTRANTLRLWIAAGLLPVQFVLLRFGEPHGTTDAVGVLLTIVQWFLIGHAFVPRARATAAAAPAT